LVNNGDKVIRQNIEPNDVIIPYDGEILSQAEINRLRKIEELYNISNFQ